MGRDGSKKKWPESGHFSFWAVIETPANPMKTEFVGTLPDLRSLRSRARLKRWNTEKTIYPVFWFFRPLKENLMWVSYVNCSVSVIIKKVARIEPLTEPKKAVGTRGLIC